MSWGWRPSGAPSAGETGGGEGAVSWRWTVALRDGPARRIEIQLSRSLVQSIDAPDLPRDLREAVLTKGRSEIVRVALWEEPPSLIVVEVTGRERVGGRVATPMQVDESENPGTP
jgi:hypothetical protein